MFLNRDFRSGIWYIWYNDENNKRKRISTGTRNRREAKQKLIEFAVEMKRLGKRKLFDTFASEYLGYSKINHSAETTNRIAAAITQLRKFIGNPYLEELDGYTFEKYKTTRSNMMVSRSNAQQRKLSPVTINVEIRHLKTMFNKAVEWGFLERSPMQGIKTIRIVEKSPQFLTETQFRQLLEACGRPSGKWNDVREWLRPLVTFALATGMRRAELCSLTWKQVDLVERVVKVANQQHFRTKSGKERYVPLNQLAYEVLRSLPQRSEYVFVHKVWNTYHPLRPDQVTIAVGKAMRRAGLVGMKLHSLRHSFITHMLKAGATIQEVQQIVGHSTIQMTERYNHMVSRELHHAINRFPITSETNSIPCEDQAPAISPPSTAA